ncbi:MAG: glucosaminidase domain-containing protein [Flavobacteriales bacterium]|nr:glucosaminidase domain-containing protein [Flavobacteriales bacterium]
MHKLLFAFCLIFLASCSTQKKTVSNNKGKSVIQTSKPTATTSRPANTSSRPASTNVSKPTVSESTSPKEELKATSTVKITQQVVLDYIDQFKETAKSNMKEFGIPASITLAQGILESGAGTARLSVQANNHFGIKCHKEWQGDQIFHDDDAKDECFRKYKDPSESFRDHALFLSTRKYYVQLFTLEKDNYKAWAKGLKDAGYATDPKYPDKLTSLIERYQLHRFDAEVLGKPVLADEKPKSNPSSNSNSSIETTLIKTHRVEKGDTLYSLSRKYQMTLEELKKMNNLNDNNISIGQILKVK